MEGLEVVVFLLTSLESCVSYEKLITDTVNSRYTRRIEKTVQSGQI